MCRSRRELSNEYLLSKFGFDTAENEPCKACPLSAYRSPRYDPIKVLGFDQCWSASPKETFTEVCTNECKHGRPTSRCVYTVDPQDHYSLADSLEGCHITGLCMCKTSDMTQCDMEARFIECYRTLSQIYDRGWVSLACFGKLWRARLYRSQILQANSKCSLESSRRDLHNALLCTVLESQFFVKNC